MMKYLGGIRGRLMVLIGLCLTPLALLYLWHLNSDRETRLNQALHQLSALTDQIATIQIGQISSMQTMLRMLADINSVQSVDLPRCQAHLRHAKATFEFLSVVFVTDRAGHVQCSTSDKHVDLSDRPYIKTTVDTGRFTLSDYLIGRMSGLPVLIGALPVRNDTGEIIGVIAAGVDLSWLRQVAQNMAGSLDMSITIIDSKGVILASAGNLTEDQSVLVGRDISDQGFIQSVLINRQGQMSHVKFGHDGPAIITYSPLNGSSATVIAAIPEARILAPIDRELYLSLAALVLVGILSLAGALIFADRDIIVWIDALKEAADRLEAEDFSQSPKVPPQPGELRELALSFVNMGQRLKEIAQLDRLTRLPNKNFLDSHLEALRRQILADGRGALAILYIDLDGFKQINENYGRLLGDKILQAAAERLRAAMPAHGLLARIGGDEFMAVLSLDGNPSARLTEARRTAEQLVAAFNGGIVLAEDDEVVPLGCSIGLSVWNGGDDSLDDVIRDADDALFRAKRQGRRCFMIVHNTMSDVAI